MKPPRVVCMLLVLSLAIGRDSAAEVLDAGPGGFTVGAEVVIAAARPAVYSSFTEELGRWWSPDLTVSGYAEAMYIDPRPMGCFCETLRAGSGIVHLTVTLVDANNMLRLSGGLGPLGLLGAAGNMTFEFDDVGERTRVTMLYAVGGYRAGGLDALAAEVDAALTDQLDRLKRFVETGRADAGRK